MNVQKEITQLYINKNSKKISPVTGSNDKSSRNLPITQLKETNEAKTLLSTKTPNLQTEKLIRSQNKRPTQIQNRKFLVHSSNKMLKDFSSALNPEMFSKGVSTRKNTFKKDSIDDENISIPYRNVLTEANEIIDLKENNPNQSMDLEDQAENIDKVEKVETVTISTLNAKSINKKPKSKNWKTAKSLTNVQLHSLGIGIIYYLI